MLAKQQDLLGLVVPGALYRRAVCKFTRDTEANGVLAHREAEVEALSSGWLSASDIVAETVPVSVAVQGTARIFGQVCHEHRDILGHIAHDSAGG